MTCNSLKSRNTSFGQLISSQPKVSITEHLKSLETTEGYFTVQAIYNIAQEKNISMPIAKSVYRILFGKVSINDELNQLLARSTKDEIY